MHELEVRVVKLEATQEFHDRELKELKNTGAKMESSLVDIKDTLKQVKWVAVGALLVIIFGDEKGIGAGLWKLLL
jgi:hypothetical protein